MHGHIFPDKAYSSYFMVTSLQRTHQIGPIVRLQDRAMYGASFETSEQNPTILAVVLCQKSCNIRYILSL